MDIINNINRIFTNNCSYKSINQLSAKKLRNIKDGVKLDEVIYYRFKYTAKNTTKSSVVADQIIIPKILIADKHFIRKKKEYHAHQMLIY